MQNKKKEVDALLESDPEIRQAMDELQSTADLLHSELPQEVFVELSPQQHQQIESQIEKADHRKGFPDRARIRDGQPQGSTLEKLADKGNGHYAYIDDIDEARKVMVGWRPDASGLYPIWSETSDESRCIGRSDCIAPERHLLSTGLIMAEPWEGKGAKSNQRGYKSEP